MHDVDSRDTSLQALHLAQRIIAARSGLSVDAILMGTPLDSLGLDSLAWVSVLNEIAADLNVEVSPEAAFDCEVVGDLASLFDPQRASTDLLSSSSERPVKQRESLAGRCRESNVPIKRLMSSGQYQFAPVIELADGVHVTVNGHKLLLLNSYNYLGFNNHPKILEVAHRAIDEFGPAIHGARLLSGTTRLHRELEESIAQSMRSDAAIVFNTGYVACVSVIQALLNPGDVAVIDEFAHASLFDGVRMSGAKLTPFRHNDPEDLAKVLSKCNERGVRMVIVDGVYSMEGDIANIPEISPICRRYGASLLVDEAHSFGVLGETGMGIQEHFGLPPDTIDVKVGTLSKALSSCGGFVAAGQEIVDYLRHNARGYVFSVGLSNVQVAVAREALRLLVEDSGHIQQLHRLLVAFRDSLSEVELPVSEHVTPIFPLNCITADHTYNLTQEAYRNGLLVSPVVYPAVPYDKPRIRLSLTSRHSPTTLGSIATILARLAKENR